MNKTVKKTIFMLLAAGLIISAGSIASARARDFEISSRPSFPAETGSAPILYTKDLTHEKWTKILPRTSLTVRSDDTKITVTLTDDASSGNTPVMFRYTSKSVSEAFTLSEGESKTICLDLTETFTIKAKFKNAGDNGRAGITVQLS